MEIRLACASEVEVMIKIEQTCFPPAEAADAESIRQRFAVFGECFVVAVEEGQIIGFINGCVTDKPELPDILYHDVTLHQPTGSYQTVFGLNVLPEYRRKGIATQLIQAFIKLAKERRRKGIVLTCKDHLIPLYSGQGFVCQGVSASTHGGSKWNDMLLTF